MEAWENKIIADKMHSLQDLPEDYQPNLDAKWSILEAGLPASKRKTGFLFRYAAAAILLLGSFGLLWKFYPAKKVPGQEVVTRSVPVAIKSEKPAVAITIQPVRKSPAGIKKIKPDSHQQPAFSQIKQRHESTKFIQPGNDESSNTGW
jgi:hypothetical protein